MAPPVFPSAQRGVAAAFTLIELLVSMAVLLVLIGIISQIFNATAATTAAGNAHMNCDAQGRAVLDRMGIDFGQMLLRPDVDYYLKSSAIPQMGNDQLAFFSQVPGYYAGGDAHSLSSLVAYRMQATGAGGATAMQRMGKGLAWNGSSSAGLPMCFLPLTIAATWPAATNADADGSYELIGPQVFRFEYNYLLRGQTAPDGTACAPIQSGTPWETRIPDHTSPAGMRDVAAVIVTIAIIDPRDRNLLTVAQTNALATRMDDYAPAMQQNELKTQWQAAIDDPANGLPRAVAARVRLYQRSFHINSLPSPSS